MIQQPIVAGLMLCVRCKDVRKSELKGAEIDLSDSKGISLQQLKELANGNGMRMRVYKRTNSSGTLPVPSIVHLKSGHFVALLKESGDRYYIRDATFRSKRWVFEVCNRGRNKRLCAG